MTVYRPSAVEWPHTRLARFIERYGYSSLEELLERAETDPDRFWDRVVTALGVEWAKPYWRTLDLSRGAMWPEWFVGGELDLAYNVVGKHASVRPYKTALRWEGDRGEVRCLSYAELARQVDAAARGLCSLGVRAGDRVALYLPMIPEAAVAMLAATRIGAIVVPFFSGYGADAVAQRLQDCEAKVLVCASAYFRRGKRINMLDDARQAALASPTIRYLLVVGRPEEGDQWACNSSPQVSEGFAELDFNNLVKAFMSAHLGVDEDGGAGAHTADHPLMLVYTSGTTGRPKGVIHTHGGFPLKAAQDLMMAFDLHEEDTLMWITDMGWLMGPWVVYGGLLLGATIVLFEGTADYPDTGRLWQLVSRHRVTHLGMSPTLVRMLMANDCEVPDELLLASLRVFGSTGEAWNEVPWRWLFAEVGRGRRPIVNYSGGTEIGGGIIASLAGLPQKPCAFSGPIPGMAAAVVGPDGGPVRGVAGELAISRPWLGMTRGFWRDDSRYEETYWSQLPGMWMHGDRARIDEDGFWFIEGRSDDTLKIAGKRVGPCDYESALVTHPLVAEAAAIGVPDEIKGESAVCFVTLRDAAAVDGRSWSDCEGELIELVGNVLGKPLRPLRIHRVNQIPKTRNGKLLRRVIRSTYLGLAVGDVSGMDNPASVAEFASLRCEAIQ